MFLREILLQCPVCALTVCLRIIMNNYDKLQKAAQQRFCGYDKNILAKKDGVCEDADHLYTRFFMQEVKIRKLDGEITVDGRPAGFGEALAVYDWLCDRRENACAVNEYCQVEQLASVHLSGGGLPITAPVLAQKIQMQPQRFAQLCRQMGGKEMQLGDIGCCVEIFPGLCVCIKFYYGDDEFAPSVSLLWDKNILQFVRYETVYYIAAACNSFCCGNCKDVYSALWLDINCFWRESS